MTDSEKIVEEIESVRAAQFIENFAERGTLREKSATGYSHAEKRIAKYGRWKELEMDLRSRNVEYKTDDFLNPAPSDEEILFFRYITDDELMRKSGLHPGNIHSGFNDDTYIFDYYNKYRRILKKGNRWKALLAAQRNAGGNYRSVIDRIIRIIFYVGLIGYIGWMGWSIVFGDL